MISGIDIKLWFLMNLNSSYKRSIFFITTHIKSDYLVESSDRHLYTIYIRTDEWYLILRSLVRDSISVSQTRYIIDGYHQLLKYIKDI